MSDLLRQIDAIDHKAADWLSCLAASADEMKADDGKNWRGGLMGAFNQYAINDAERHLLCLAAFGHESSKDLAPGQCKALVYWLNDGGADLVGRICVAALKAQGQKELPDIDPVIQTAVSELGAELHRKGDLAMSDNAEALFSATAKMKDPSGAEWLITVRDGQIPGDSAAEKAENCARLSAYLIGKGWKANGYSSASASHPINVEKPPTPPAPGAPAAQTQGSGDGVQSGAGPLTKITVDADGKVEFHVGSFRWPFKDGRGAEVVAGLFDSDLGWRPEHFAPGAKYDGDQVLGLVVEWAKPGKYYDVVRVRKA